MQNVLSTHEFEGRIRSLHNHLYANANIRTTEGIAGELAKVLMALNFHASRRQPPLMTVADVKTVLEGSADVLETLADETRGLFELANIELGHYPSESRLLLDDESLAVTRSMLRDVDFATAERDWLGDAVETVRSISAKRLGGQFFTDQRVTELAVTLLEFDPTNGDDFVDICAGTGGFLLAAARHLVRDGLADHVKSILGAEIDPELARSANGSLGSLTGEEGRVAVVDSLADTEDWSPDARRSFVSGTHRCLASNPPFGMKITIKNKRVLSRFELARRWTRKGEGWECSEALSARPPDVLFIEQNLRLAEPGKGRVALVTPYQVLSGPQLGYVREWILRNARIRAVVDLPADTFQPWTGTKTSLLVLERRVKPLDQWDPGVDREHKIFMSVSSQIGHDRRGNPVLNSDGEILTDLPEIAKAWQHFRGDGDPGDVNAESFIVDAAQITHESGLRLNAAFHLPANNKVTELVRSMGARQGWTLSTIGEESERIFFPGRFKRDYFDDGVPFFGGTQITQLLPTNVKYLSTDNPKVQELLVEEGWVLVTRSGSTGIISSVATDMAGVAFSEHIIRIVPKAGAVPGEYIEAYLRSSIGQALLAVGVFGSVIDEITPDYVADIPLAIPPAKLLAEIVKDGATARTERASAAAAFTRTSDSVDRLLAAVGRRPVA
jgi:type I restriction-modification system DNA methylase subunit